MKGILTDSMLRAVAPGEKLTEYWDAKVGGLCLRVTPGGAKSWTFRYRPKDSVSFKRVGLGRYPEISLSTARQRAESLRVAVSGGGDPQGERQAKKEAERTALTFRELSGQYVDRYAKVHKASWRNDEIYLRAHVLPKWGDRKAARIGRQDAAELLDAIAAVAPTSANRTHSVLSKLFNWGVESGLVPTNPFHSMKKRAREKAKERVLTDDEIRILWTATASPVGFDPIKGALRFLLLTGQRPGEVAGAAFSELVDLKKPDGARWEIPGARMKAGRPHVVPLAPMALEIADASSAARVKGQEAVFPSRYADRGPIARHTLSQFLKKLIDGLPEGEETKALKANPPTPHDFRRTVATRLAALGVAREDRLAVLAHAASDIHAEHYDRYERLPEKRRALEIWEHHLSDVISAEARR